MKGQQVRIAMGGLWSELNSDANFCIPEHKLVAAIITRAILDYINPGFLGKSQRNKVKGVTRAFLFSEETEEEWSFYWLLSHISNSPDVLKKKIQRFCVENEDNDFRGKCDWAFTDEDHRKHPKFFRLK